MVPKCSLVWGMPCLVVVWCVQLSRGFSCGQGIWLRGLQAGKEVARGQGPKVQQQVGSGVCAFLGCSEVCTVVALLQAVSRSFNESFVGRAHGCLACRLAMGRGHGPELQQQLGLGRALVSCSEVCH